MSDDAKKLKKDIKEVSLGYSQEIGQAILNIINSGGVAAGGKLNFTIDQNVPLGHTIMYSGSPGGNTIHYSVNSGGAGGGGGSYAGGNYTANWVEGCYEPFKPVNTEELAEKIATRYVPGETLVVCVDNELTSAEMDEITAHLTRHNIHAVIIRGARAGTGRPPGNVTDEGKRIDILARIAETWERHPDLTFAELIRWWSGENMTDDDFAAATDVYAKKVYE